MEASKTHLEVEAAAAVAAKAELAEAWADYEDAVDVARKLASERYGLLQRMAVDVKAALAACAAWEKVEVGLMAVVALSGWEG